MRMKTDLTTQIQQLLTERQRHTDALSEIDQTLGRIKALLTGGTNGRQTPERLAKPRQSRAEVASGGTSPVTLADHVEAVMRKAAEPLSIADLMAAVKAAGYKSKSKDFRPVVSLALIKDKRFKRVGRGVYTVR